ncbi:MAG: hypothetical protein KatS3mg105_5229 [Gemmatales bacterium]|nr:MAG: hypothetical protein KatS3mg105_5229 [Gemmatales bacterium]
MQRSLIVSTCGTSLLTNGAASDLRKVLYATTNCQENELDEATRSRIEERLREQKARLDDISDANNIRQMAAELNGILGLYDDRLEKAKADHHILIHTDTWQGEQVAQLLAGWLRQKGVSAQSQKVDDLRTSDLESFQSGLNSLVAWCEATLPGYREQQYHIVFNLVGGFKSLQGFMQTLGMFYADELVYIFETGNQLLQISRLPIQIEEAATDAIRNNLAVFRRLDDPQATCTTDEVRGIPETFLYRLDNAVDLSPWGRLIWQRHKREFYRERILEPISSKLVISVKVMQEAENLQPDLRERFNQRMDDLSRYLDSGQNRAINRLDFKQLKGNPRPPSTHECDLWADQGAWRAFGHFDNQQFIVDDIGPGLH